LRALQHLAKRTVRRIGYELISPRNLWRAALASHLRSLFERYRIDAILDVGANRGQYRDFLRNEVGFGGLVVSFEPLPSLSQVLRERAQRDERWLVFPFALGARVERRPIHVTQHSVFSSFLDPAEAGPALFGQQMAVSATELVDVRRLDDVMGEVRDEVQPGRTYVKLDTQGSDLDVIEGARNVLPSVRALQTELAFIPIYRGMPVYEQTLRALADHGFEVSGFFPVNFDDRLRIIEADCVLVNSRLPLDESGGPTRAG
jgi:FkbM family methyltransferase